MWIRSRYVLVWKFRMNDLSKNLNSTKCDIRQSIVTSEMKIQNVKIVRIFFTKT